MDCLPQYLMPISDEELIAFLLGDASPEVCERIELALATDPSVVARIDEFKQVLNELDALEHSEPPHDLFSKTMSRIDSLPANAGNDFEPVPELVQPSTLMSPSGQLASRSRRVFWDSTVLVVCMAALCGLLLPALMRIRFESRRAQCANNLRVLGAGLIDLALASPGQRFPQIAQEGPEAFAGIYAVRLSDAGLLERPSQLNCASLIGSGMSTQLQGIPSLADLKLMPLVENRQLQRVVGGDYAYNLGVMEEEKVAGPRCEGRCQFVILADAPIYSSGREQFIAHDGQGLNLVFEDGHVAFVRVKCWDVIGDNPFCNFRGAREAGVNKHDASLGPSYFTPLGN